MDTSAPQQQQVEKEDEDEAYVSAPETPPPPPRSTAKDVLALPSAEVLRQIAERQDARAAEIRARRAERKSTVGRTTAEKQDTAARLIQRNYRGHRTRRAMEGRGLDPSLRWLEALKEAKFTNVTAPRSRNHNSSFSSPGSNKVRERWRKASAVVHRAGSDDTSESEVDDATEEERAAHRERQRKEKREREKYAQVMGLDYFLEMVDHKHRYGSNLRRYHKEWKASETRENFFYWLDYGEGKDLDLPDRPRTRLDTEHVRYLSREDRQKYQVNIDKEGRFVFAKNGVLVTTAPEFRDSIDGIVPHDSPKPTWREVVTGEKDPPPAPGSDSDSLSSMSSIGTGKQEDGSKYTNDELHDARGLHKVGHINANSVMNHLLRKTTKKNTWIFVADTSFRMYVGIKQSGAFQHSSFLHGARVSAAGLIKIKRGQLRKLSPLSGHYAPPLRNFREFVRNLKEAGADMSHCSISRSYAVLLGLEGYLGAKKQVKGLEQGVKDMVDPEGKRQREEAERDKSKSAQREREVMAEEEARKKDKRRFSLRFKKMVGWDGGGRSVLREEAERDIEGVRRERTASDTKVLGERKQGTPDRGTSRNASEPRAA